MLVRLEIASFSDDQNQLLSASSSKYVRRSFCMGLLKIREVPGVLKQNVQRINGNAVSFIVSYQSKFSRQNTT